MKKIIGKALALIVAISMTVIPTASVLGAENEDFELESISESIDDDEETSKVENDIEIGQFGENVIYELNKTTGVMTVSGSGEMRDYKYAEDTPFYNDHSTRKAVKKIVIEEGITSIGKAVFYGYSNLESISIPDSIEKIGDVAFSGCLNLKEILLPNSIKSIGDNAFAGCGNLIEITIPEKITSIGNGTFGACESLKTVFISNSVKDMFSEEH